VQIPAILGVGQYSLAVDLQQTGGLYPSAVVTYRGLEVGKVRSIDVRPGGGVVARIDVKDGTKLPADSTVEVGSNSVIGEQFLNFLPPQDGQPEPYLEDGDVIPETQTSLPTTTTALLDSVDRFFASIPRTSLRTTMKELSRASVSSGEDLGRFLDDASAFSDTAQRNLQPTTDLIDQLHPVLRTQHDLDPSIRSYAQSLDQLTGQLDRSDADLRAVIRAGSPLVRSVAGFTSAVGEPLTGVVDDLGGFARPLRVYRRGIEHILIVLPAAAAMAGAGTPPDQIAAYEKDHSFDARNNLYFKMSFPTACTTGFPARKHIRDPYDLSLAPLPQDSYCQVPHDSDLVVRGARNDPCPNSTQRGPTAASCGLIFDEAAAERSATFRGPGGDLAFDPQMARTLAPNGPLFLEDATAASGPRTWQELLLQLVTR
jgi:phospholipid/cholesterol/gamma-HCH transport system substrate-binding protein